ncbi:lamin tail domain-containing protein [Engelhardtia mirabilis]|uniref:LTD domain-containing protein n=1 Tax=Engelhardtia mirabilis TaxID=2528011 RepID=A0A518BEX7_9BACT|nr:hypothetical protein Pla133_05960 [Planctomycetes bacterium Pla133]QDU99857.1 hypothetical protein Pla86_05960 [Planctomycetes bacterium Pla86]
MRPANTLRPSTQALIAALAACGVSAPAAAQTFGTGCAGASGKTPTIEADELIVDGSDFGVEITGGPNLFGYLLVGANNTTWNGLDLPLDLGAFAFGDCDLLVSVNIVVPITTDGLGQSSLTLPGFGGFIDVYLQVVLADVDLVDFDPPAAFSAGLTITGVPASLLQPGDLVITEVMKDPSFVTDGFGEWFEVFNTTDADIDVNHWTITDGGTDSILLDAGAPLIVPAHSFAVLGNNADPAVNGGIDMLVDYSLYGTLNFSNAADSLVLTTPDQIVVDAIVWDDGVEWPDEPGQSMQLVEGVFEFDLNDDGGNWEVTECFIGGTPFNTDRGTPGTPAGDCANPTLPFGTGEIIFSEIMQNPSSVADTVGEWFEVYNTTGAAIDLDGWTFAQGGGSFVVAGSFSVPAGGYRVLARIGDSLVNGGLPLDVYDYDDTLFLPNGSQTLTILDASGATSCLLQYDNGLTYPDPSGASMSLDPTHLDVASAVDGSFWCEAISLYGDGDLGTPGVANDSCGP